MQTKSYSSQDFRKLPERQKVRHVLRPPLALLAVPNWSPIFNQLKAKSGQHYYLKTGLSVQPGWHSNFRGCYYALLHVYLEAERTRQTIEFQNNFDKVLSNVSMRLDSFRREQIEPAHRTLYNHDTLIALIQDFLSFLRSGQNLLQQINQHPVIDLALILLLRSIVLCTQPPTPPPYSFCHVPSKLIASAISTVFETPVDYNQQTEQMRFLEFNLVLKENLGEVVIRENCKDEALNQSDVNDFAGLLGEEKDQKHQEEEKPSPFQKLPFEESFQMDGEEGEKEQGIGSPMKDSCYMKLKELYESNLVSNNCSPKQLNSIPERPIQTNTSISNRMLYQQPIIEPTIAQPNRFQPTKTEPLRVEWMGSKKPKVESIRMEIPKIQPVRIEENKVDRFEYGRVQKFKTEVEPTSEVIKKYVYSQPQSVIKQARTQESALRDPIRYENVKKQPLIRIQTVRNDPPKYEYLQPQQRRDRIRYNPSLKNLNELQLPGHELNDGVTSDDVLNILSPAVKKYIYDASGRTEETVDRNKSFGSYNIQYQPANYSTQSVYRQAPSHSQPLRLEVRKPISKILNKPAQTAYKQASNQPRSYKDLIKAPANIKIPAGLFKTNSFASTFQGDNSQHRDIQTLEPPKLLMGTSSQHARPETLKLEPRLQLTQPVDSSYRSYQLRYPS